jgi:transposase-like protein
MYNFNSGIMKAKRRKFTAAFKAQVALAAIQERESLSELSKRFSVHPTVISRWKKEFLERSAEIFETQAPDVEFEKEREKLYAKIGQLQVERDWLKKNLNKVGQ